MKATDLAILIIELLIAKGVMCILRHIEFMLLVQHHPLKRGWCVGLADSNSNSNTKLRKGNCEN